MNRAALLAAALMAMTYGHVDGVPCRTLSVRIPAPEPRLLLARTKPARPWRAHIRSRPERRRRALAARKRSLVAIARREARGMRRLSDINAGLRLRHFTIINHVRR